MNLDPNSDVKKHFRRDIFKKRPRKDWNIPTRFNDECRRPYWDLTGRNRALSLPASSTKKSSTQQRLKRLIDSNPQISKEELSRLHRLYRKLTVRNKKDILKSSTLLNIPGKFDSGILNTRYAYKRDYVKCSYTSRVLAPIIYQDFEIEPPLLKLHAELCHKIKEKYPNLSLPKIKKYPLNYLCVNNDHIPVINSLCKLYFWDGIDVSIALKYPEFSCVVTYRKIIVGFGFIAPGNHLNEAYINYILVRDKWRKCGIGQMILYHLIESCKTWDITLHVSPTNPALSIYLKFGFKINGFLKNFYEMYAKTDSNESLHALFMKLERTDYKTK